MFSSFAGTDDKYLADVIYETVVRLQVERSHPLIQSSVLSFYDAVLTSSCLIAQYCIHARILDVVVLCTGV